MKTILLLGILTSLLLTGCVDSTPDPKNQEKDCQEKKGELIPCLTDTGYACSEPTKDGGKSCKNSEECEAECVAPDNCAIGKETTGKCAERTMLVCQGVATVEDGKCGPMMIT
tara:strand:- start:43444 stop:43782 length:339 start_codon:yes stop_codon:yes gene_type:complete